MLASVQPIAFIHYLFLFIQYFNLSKPISLSLFELPLVDKFARHMLEPLA